MAGDDYTTLSYYSKFRNSVKIAGIIILFMTAVLVPAFAWWRYSVTRSQTFREAKNVVLNLQLIGMEYYGFPEEITDKNRMSGLSQEAEDEVRKLSAAEGEISLISWDSKQSCPIQVDYQKNKFLIRYYYNREEKKEYWNIYHNTWSLERERNSVVMR